MTRLTHFDRPRASFRFFGAGSSGRRSFTATTVMKLLARSDVTLTRLVTTIEGDPVFARHVRNVARDRAQRRFKIRSTRDAVSFVGFSELDRLARNYGRGAGHRKSA